MSMQPFKHLCPALFVSGGLAVPRGLCCCFLQSSLANDWLSVEIKFVKEGMRRVHVAQSADTGATLEAFCFSIDKDTIRVVVVS